MYSTEHWDTLAILLGWKRLYHDYPKSVEWYRELKAGEQPNLFLTGSTNDRGVRYAANSERAVRYDMDQQDEIEQAQRAYPKR